MNEQWSPITKWAHYAHVKPWIRLQVWLYQFAAAVHSGHR
jgi:hypothetical protein